MPDGWIAGWTRAGSGGLRLLCLWNACCKAQLGDWDLHFHWWSKSTALATWRTRTCCLDILGRVLSPGFAATRFLSTRLNPRHRILVTHLLQALNIPYCVLIFAFLNRSLCCWEMRDSFMNVCSPFLGLSSAVFHFNFPWLGDILTIFVKWPLLSSMGMNGDHWHDSDKVFSQTNLWVRVTKNSIFHRFFHFWSYFWLTDQGKVTVPFFSLPNHIARIFFICFAGISYVEACFLAILGCFSTFLVVFGENTVWNVILRALWAVWCRCTGLARARKKP